MTRIREEYDADLIRPNEPSLFETAANRYGLNCCECGRFYFVDCFTLDRYNNAIKRDSDNQFICPNCRRQDEDAAYE